MRKQLSTEARKSGFLFAWPPPRAVTLILGILHFIALASPLGASVVAWALTILVVLVVSAVAVKVVIEVVRRYIRQI